MTGASFLLGTHQSGWLARADVPLTVSHHSLHGRRLPRARCWWALDSGGFTELLLFGCWQTSPAAYAAAVPTTRTRLGGSRGRARSRCWCHDARPRRRSSTS
jgi:hypothetical protein